MKNTEMFLLEGQLRDKIIFIRQVGTSVSKILTQRRIVEENGKYKERFLLKSETRENDWFSVRKIVHRGVQKVGAL
jgi:hypothetical protein